MAGRSGRRGGGAWLAMALVTAGCLAWTPHAPEHGDAAACADVQVTVDPSVIGPGVAAAVSGVVTNNCDVDMFLHSGPCAARGLHASIVAGPGDRRPEDGPWRLETGAAEKGPCRSGPSEFSVVSTSILAPQATSRDTWSWNGTLRGGPLEPAAPGVYTVNVRLFDDAAHGNVTVQVA